MGILHRKFKNKIVEDSFDDDDSLGNIIIKIINPYLVALKQTGIKNKIEEVLTGVSLDTLLINKIRKHLVSVKFVELGRGIGRVAVQYRNYGIQLEPMGLLRLIIKRITITDEQIIGLMNDVLNQIEEKYVNDTEYFISKIKEIVKKLDESEVYKPKTSEEKTLYDLVLMVLLNHYKIMDDIPDWIRKAVNNIEQPDFIEDWIKVIIEQVGTIASNMSDNLYVDFKVTFDSKILRAILNSQTNKGQISKLLSIMDINIKSIIYNLAENYISPSFIKGLGELIGGIASNFLSDLTEREKKYRDNCCIDNKKSVEEASQITMTVGQTGNERNFRWYTSVDDDKSCLQYSEDENFVSYNKVKANIEIVPKMKTNLNLGLIASYSVGIIKKYSVSLCGLKPGKTYYYRIGNDELNKFEETYKFSTHNEEKFNFIVFADSQGMVKYDYHLFLRVFADACKRIHDSHFIVHMGDFVDDGNNEEYWNWLLDSRLWKENMILPVVGNHEARRSGIAYRAGVQNSVLGHFNVYPLVKQDLTNGMYYSYVYGNAKFVVLNTNDMDERGKLSKEQFNWALNELRSTDKKWRIIITHKSPYSNGPHHSESDIESMSEQIINLAYVGQVDLVIGGHDHVYVRTPIMSKGREIDCKRKIVKRKGVKYETYVDPNGTLFIVPGTTGVKNYKQNSQVTFPIELQKDLDCPVYSHVEVEGDFIYFTSYKYDVIQRTSLLIDSFAINKSDESEVKISDKKVSELLNVLSDEPGTINKEKVLKLRKYYNILDYSQRVRVNNRKLIRAEKLQRSYDKIFGSEIVMVRNKCEFLNAIKNENIGTIVVNCNEIKFENSFGMKNKCLISRDLCIRGRARLNMVNFCVTGGATLILDDNICIDNTRRLFSMYHSLSAIDIYDNSTVVINGNVSIRSAYGVGIRSRGINLFGEGCSVYLNSKSENWGSDGFLVSYSSTSKVVVNGGKYRASRGRYTFNIAGGLELNNGEINNIKTGSMSWLHVNGGCVGSEKTNDKLVSIDCSGKMFVSSGIVKEYNGVAINLHGENAILYLQPYHKGAVKIGNGFIYMGEIESLENGRVKIKFSDEKLRRHYNMEGIYAIVDGSYGVQRLVNVRAINRYVADNSINNVMSGYKKIAIRATHINKNDNIVCNMGAKCYLFSRFKDLY